MNRLRFSVVRPAADLPSQVMRLPEKAFARIRRSLGVDEPTSVHPITRPRPGEAGDDDNKGRSSARREARWRVNVDVPVARHGTVGGMLRTVSLQDLSAVGACIVSTQQLGAGDRFILYLPWGKGEFTPVVCTVKTVRIKQDGTWRIGAEFVEAGDALLRRRGRVRTANALGQDPADIYFRVSADPRQSASGGQKQRRHERKDLPPGQATIYTCDDAAGEEKRGPLEHVEARDVSDGGVSILRHEPFDLGQRFVVHLAAPGAESLTRLCRVANVTFSDNRYRIGAEFVSFSGNAAPSQGKLSQRFRRWFSGEMKAG